MAIRTGATADGQADGQPDSSTGKCMGQSQRRIHCFAAWALGRADRQAEMASTRLDACAFLQTDRRAHGWTHARFHRRTGEHTAGRMR
eukprot:364529-Chlamydomonas_euryale.AAC.6